jgi:DNA repair exonuclease SbcCD ATPase subunit
VIEAVGLALFDAWPRKFRDGNARTGFIRKGEKEASIEVEVQRGAERFTVRCELVSRKRKGSESIDYERSIFDAHGSELANSGGRKKDFQDDMRLHILGEARIDDERLFRDIIGTEQGGFDDPFTRTENERRELFEKILGIEDFQTFEKQFYAFVKWQASQLKELNIRYDERSGVRAELEEAMRILSDREEELRTAEQTLAAASKNSAAAKAVVEALSAVRDELQTLRSEKQRLQEKLNGSLDAERKARGLLDEAKLAAATMREALPGFGQHVGAGKTLDALRKSVKERDTAKQQLAEEATRFESTDAKLQAGREAALQELAGTRTAIEAAKQDILERETRIATLRDEFARLDEERKSVEIRAQLAGELRSYVQDVNTTRKTLLAQGSKIFDLRSTFDVLNQRLADIQLDVPFLPALREESELLFERFTTAEATTEESTVLDAMLSEALGIEKRLQKLAKDAVKDVSTVKEQGVSERKQLDEKQLALKAAIEKEAQLTVQETDLTAEIVTLRAAWLTSSSALNVRLEQYAKLDEHITTAEAELERSRPAYEAYLAAQTTAAQLSQREADVNAVALDIANSRNALGALSVREEQLSQAFSESDYTEAKTDFDAASVAEKEAHAGHGRIAALVKEQGEKVASLQKAHKDFLKLESMLTQAKAESAFSGEVHQHVVRELAKHVGASIVSALSAFAAELYQRIAPEQGLQLHWDEQTYAVELRDGERRIRGRELSGGQLMGVSLAVKLALIKWYSQCRIGFLDEPTTHLDKETRRHLADVIEHLEELTGDNDPWFDQLFIISHEESFSGAGHRIELERSPDHGSKLMTEE